MTTVFEFPGDARNIIERLLDMLSLERIYREVEHPIEKANSEFKIDIEEPITPAIFNKVIADFTKLIFGTALRFRRRLSDREALAEAIHLLIHYSDAEGPDRYGAILSSVTGGDPEDLKKVLSQLSEIIKEVERNKYIQWVFNYHFRSLEWGKRCHIAAAYRESIFQFLPTGLQNLREEQLVDYFKDVIKFDLDLRNFLNQIGLEE